MPEITVVLDTTICESEAPFKLYGNEYFTTGLYNDTLVSANGCKTILNLNLKVIDEVTPLFVQMGPYYQFSKAPKLPLISFDGVKGTWNPSTIETSKIGVTKYIFIPDDGECAVETSIDITVKAIGFLLNCPPDTLLECNFNYDIYPAFTKFSDFEKGGGFAFSKLRT
ncbi:MAG: hypothetical protein MZV70_45910 [Desulfobacterales bacterium]|nr:hypothetical protein [Desulfobacterales bacterium]